MRRRRPRPQPRPFAEALPWTPSEDAVLTEISAIGLANDFWPLALPNRRFGEIAERRVELGVKLAAPL
jgi:hypothetical protein